MIRIKSPVTWIGNKTSILHILYALFPIGCDRYVEPFGGSGAVLLGKPVPDKFEVFNDYNHMKGKFLLSYNDCPEIRELYKEYNFFDFKRVHSMAQKYEAGKEFPELLIANYDLFERERQQPHQLTLFDSIDKPLDYEKILKENIVCRIKR